MQYHNNQYVTIPDIEEIYIKEEMKILDIDVLYCDIIVKTGKHLFKDKCSPLIVVMPDHLIFDAVDIHMVIVTIEVQFLLTQLLNMNLGKGREELMN